MSKNLAHVVKEQLQILKKLWISSMMLRCKRLAHVPKLFSLE